MSTIREGLTYDDVLLVPKRTSLRSRKEADLHTKLTRNIVIALPIISANMDTVTESEMAIQLARFGGMGIIHRFMSIEDNVTEIQEVKRAGSFIIEKPETLPRHATVVQAREVMARLHISGILIADHEHHLQGILSRRDILFESDQNKFVGELMTPREKLITAPPHTTLTEARAILHKYKIEKLPLITSDGQLAGLITAQDIELCDQFPNATKNSKGRLRVGGSIGVQPDSLDRARALVEAGIDVLTLDIAHGHADQMVEMVTKLRAMFGANIDIIAGNVATAEGARDLISAGADAIKVGVGPGTTCITRIVTGSGVPQLTAVMECATVGKQYGVPIIADGGIRTSGDIIKALAAGADTVMCGGLFAGTEESPGLTMLRNGKKFKVVRGSASFSVSQHRRNLGLEYKILDEVVPEGVEAVTPYKGTIKELLGQLAGGIRSGMSYSNAHTIAELQNNAEFIRITDAGRRESNFHDLEGVVN